MEEEALVNGKSDDAFLVSEAMKEEEERLLEARVAEEVVEREDEAHLDDSQFKKLDELLTQTKLYTEFLMEKMEDITFVSPLVPFIDESSLLGSQFFFGID